MLLGPEIQPGERWRFHTGKVIEIISVRDDLVVYERVSGPGMSRGRCMARSLISNYEHVPREERS